MKRTVNRDKRVKNQTRRYWKGFENYLMFLNRRRWGDEANTLRKLFTERVNEEKIEAKISYNLYAYQGRHAPKSFKRYVSKRFPRMDWKPNIVQIKPTVYKDLSLTVQPLMKPRKLNLPISADWYMQPYAIPLRPVTTPPNPLLN